MTSREEGGLPSRRAIVTGGCRGIGEAIVDRLRESGTVVLTADLDPSADLVLDVSSSTDIEAHADEFANIDILVNSAGIVGPNSMLWETPEEDWRRTMEVNLTGSFLTCRAVVPGMRKRNWGRIVNIASVAGKEGNPGLSAYSASKAGLIGMTKSLGKELALDGILVNAVTPAVIDSPMNRDTAPDVLDYMTSKIPMGRLGHASEVAHLVSWLCSEECSFSTGAVFDLSGGRATY